VEFIIVITFYALLIVILGFGLLTTFSRIKSLRQYALFLSLFVTTCMFFSLFYVQHTVLPREFSIVPPRPAELRGFPVDVLTTYTLDGQTTTSQSGWRATNLLQDELFYLLAAFVLLGGYVFIKKIFVKSGRH